MSLLALPEVVGRGVGGHIFVGSKAAWDEIGGSAPRFDAYPAGMGPSRQDG